MGTERVYDILEDRGVDNGSLNPKGVLSRWVPPDQHEGLAITVEEVGSDEGEVPASEEVKLDHGEVRRSGCGREVKRRQAREGSLCAR